MAGFTGAWEVISKPRNGEAVSQNLKPLLERVYSDFQADSVDLTKLKEHLIELLGFLNAEGRTNANCWATDLFFCLADEIGWEKDWVETELPDDFHDLLADLGAAFHDSVESPNIAANFNSLPEQLLDRARQLKISK